MPVINSQGQVVYQSGEALPTVGSSAYQQAQSGVIPSLPQATPPTSVGGTTSVIGSTQMPTNLPKTPDLSSIGGLLSYYDSAFKTSEQQQQDYQKQIEALKTQQVQQTSPFLSKIFGAQSPSEVKSQAEEEIGVNAKEYFAEQKAILAEIKTLNEDFNAEVAKRDAEIAKIQDNSVGALSSAIDSNVAKVERDYAVRLNQKSANINSKAAIMEASQGNFQEAQNYVNEAVANATADLKFNYELFQTFYDINQDQIDKLDSKYQNAVADSMDFAEKAYTVAYEEKSKVGELMLQAPGAGITINDSLDTAYTKASKYQPIGGGTSGNLNTLSDNERALLSQFNSSPIVKDYNTIVAQKLSVDNIIKGGVGGPADLALVFTFMKGLDPNSVVRETEYDRAAKSGNIFKGAFAKFNGYFKENGGFLPPSVQKEFQNLVNLKLNAQTQQYNNFANQYRGIAERQGLNPENVVVNYSAALPQTQDTSTQLPTPQTNNWWGSIGNWLFGNE